MSKKAFRSINTRAAAIALQDNALAVRAMRSFTYTRAEIPLMAAPVIERDFSLTSWELQQADWRDMHRGAVASVGQRQYRAVCYPLPTEVTYIRQGHKKQYCLAFLG